MSSFKECHNAKQLTDFIFLTSVSCNDLMSFEGVYEKHIQRFLMNYFDPFEYYYYYI